MLAAARTAEEAPPTGPAALDLLWRAIGPYFEVLSAAPPLPAELLPAELLPRDWPLDTARAAFGRLAKLVASQARGYVESLMEAGTGNPGRWPRVPAGSSGGSG